jgi:hypothetical protein
MSPLESVLWWVMGVSVLAIACGVCAQGRLKHWILILLGEVPKEARPGPFGEIPRRERDWSMLSTLVDIEPPAESPAPVDGGTTPSGNRPEASAS